MITKSATADLDARTRNPEVVDRDSGFARCAPRNDKKKEPAMNFDDTPQEAEFRATARQWIAANAPKQFEAELSKSSLGRIRLEKEEIVDVGKAWQKKKADAAPRRSSA
jgi:hypothetical protein